MKGPLKSQSKSVEHHMVLQALATIRDMVFVTGFDDDVLYANDSFAKAFGLPMTEIIGKNIRTLFPKESRTLAEALQAARCSDIWNGELISHHTDGFDFWLDLTVRPIHGDSGKLSAILGVCRDLTEQKARKEELQQAKEAAEMARREAQAITEHLEKTMLLAKEWATEAELANVAKSEFLANMSHEIRTPLNAIIGMTELMGETELKTQQQEYLKLIDSSSESLLNLINDILDFSKIEAGLLELEKAEFSLQDLVETATAIFTVRAQSKGIELINYVDPNIPPVFIGDPARLRQILLNLVGNAVKFTEKGEVALKVLSTNLSAMEEGEQQKVQLNFLISDTGIGVSKKNLGKIFEKFSQADSSTTRKFGGTGLGLNISKSLTELMGGSLWAESVIGVGSTFHVDLILPIGSVREDHSKVAMTDFTKFTILVVDDNVTNRFILRETLGSRGITVKEAENGVQALRVLEENHNSIDLIISDHEMPEMDGIKLVETIRSYERYDSMKIIMLSSLGTLTPANKKQLNIAEILTKPVRQSRLFEYLRKTLAGKGEPLAASPGGDGKAPTVVVARKRILLVEDNLENQMVATRMLEKASYSVDIAENGVWGVEAAQRFQYDIILMDIQMPEMDGFQATKVIREWQRGQDREPVPIIAVTAHAIDGYRERCLEQGLDDYVAKPIRKKILLETIRKWLDPRPTLLVVDDVEDNLKLIKSFVKKLTGYKFVYARNGQEAVDTFMGRNIALILMDLEMPVKNGFEATEEIRKLPNGGSVPIIALSAHDDPGIIKKCLHVGCNSYLAKPLRKNKLVDTMKDYLGGHEAFLEISVEATTLADPSNE